MNIAELLAAARDAHQRYRDNLPRRVADGSGSTVVLTGDVEAAGQHMATACRLRAEAHVLDPQQHDPAWLDYISAYPHDALLGFYVGELIR